MSLIIHTVLLPRQSGEEHEEGERELCVQVSPPEAPQLARAAGHVLCPVPGHVPDHHAGDPAHHPAHQAGPSPPHPDVLLPQPPGLHWHNVFISHSSKDAPEHADIVSLHLLHWVQFPGIFFLNTWEYQQFPSHWWQAFGHLSPPPPYHDYKSEHVSPVSNHVLDPILYQCHFAHTPHSSSLFLWRQHAHPFLMGPLHIT